MSSPNGRLAVVGEPAGGCATDPDPENRTRLAATAARNVRDILKWAMDHHDGTPALIVSDSRSPLAQVLAVAYRRCLPQAGHVDFDAVPADEVLQALTTLPAGALAVLIQSTSFRLHAFRLRVELFKRGLKVIEHPHLGRMAPAEHAAYVDALAYDPVYLRGVGRALKARIDRARGALIESGSCQLLYDGPFEPAKLNVGDYTGMANIGGQFPIGEVFTEPRQLTRVNGRARIFAFGDADFRLNVPDRPITLTIEGGLVTAATDTTPAFERVLAAIRADELPWVRELGFGMNRAFTPERRVSDTGTYERMCGIHLSLGAKHNVYAKPELKRRGAKNHVDVFVVTDDVVLDGVSLFRDGAWQV